MAADFLNNLLEIDRSAIHKLLNNRVICNEELANHPTVQVQDNGDGVRFRVGLLGILNGMFGVDKDGYGPLMAVFDDKTGELLRFDTRPFWGLSRDQLIRLCDDYMSTHKEPGVLLLVKNKEVAALASILGNEREDDILVEAMSGEIENDHKDGLIHFCRIPKEDKDISKDESDDDLP